jgi:hypothetical protein
MRLIFQKQRMPDRPAFISRKVPRHIGFLFAAYALAIRFNSVENPMRSKVEFRTGPLPNADWSREGFWKSNPNDTEMSGTRNHSLY